MKAEVFTSDDVEGVLRKMVKVYGSGRTAKMLNVPQCSVINAVRGRKGIGGKLSAALGYQAVYVKARAATVLVLALSLMACSTGLQERAYKNEHGVYIVSQSLVNDRVTAGQPHVTSEQACWKKHTSEDMTELRKDGEEHSWYYQCKDLKEYKPGEYQASLDQPIATMYQGPVSAGLLGLGMGTGLAFSGDTVTNSNRASAGASSSATGGTAINKGRHRR